MGAPYRRRECAGRPRASGSAVAGRRRLASLSAPRPSAARPRGVGGTRGSPTRRGSARGSSRTPGRRASGSTTTAGTRTAARRRPRAARSSWSRRDAEQHPRVRPQVTELVHLVVPAPRRAEVTRRRMVGVRDVDVDGLRPGMPVEARPDQPAVDVQKLHASVAEWIATTTSSPSRTRRRMMARCASDHGVSPMVNRARTRAASSGAASRSRTSSTRCAASPAELCALADRDRRPGPARRGPRPGRPTYGATWVTNSSSVAHGRAVSPLVTALTVGRPTDTVKRPEGDARCRSGSSGWERWDSRWHATSSRPATT